MEDDVTESTDSEDEYELFAINSSKKTKPFTAKLTENRYIWKLTRRCVANIDV